MAESVFLVPPAPAHIEGIAERYCRVMVVAGLVNAEIKNAVAGSAGPESPAAINEKHEDDGSCEVGPSWEEIARQAAEKTRRARAAGLAHLIHTWRSKRTGGANRAGCPIELYDSYAHPLGHGNSWENNVRLWEDLG